MNALLFIICVVIYIAFSKGYEIDEEDEKKYRDEHKKPRFEDM